MKIEIDDSIRQAGLEPAVSALEGVYKAFIPPDQRPLMTVTWSVAKGARGAMWALAELDYDGSVERALFDPALLPDEWNMQERLRKLWLRAVEARSDRRFEQLRIDVADTIAQETDLTHAGQN